MGYAMSMRSDAPEKQKAFYHTAAWLACRSGYLKQVGGLCERCLAQGRIHPAKIVHHKEYISIDNVTDPSILLSYDNLEALCQNCHNEEHFKTKKRYTVDEWGRVAVNR